MACMSRIGLLRLTFVALGVLLLLPLYVLKGAIDSRIATQARLRHEVVAERIFDEFERELTRVIEREAARPSSAYDAPTDPAAWAPFVVGYYVVNDREPRFSVRDRANVKNRATIDARLGALQLGQATVLDAVPEQAVGEKDSVKSVVAPTSKSPPSRSSPDVLRKLNVGSQQRSVPQKKARQMKSDPLQDYAY